MEHDAVVLEQAALALLLLLLVIEGFLIRIVLLVHSVVIEWYHGQGGLRLVDLVVLNRSLSVWIISINDTLEVLIEFLLPRASILIMFFRRSDALMLILRDINRGISSSLVMLIVAVIVANIVFSISTYFMPR